MSAQEAGSWEWQEERGKEPQPRAASHLLLLGARDESEHPGGPPSTHFPWVGRAGACTQPLQPPALILHHKPRGREGSNHLQELRVPVARQPDLHQAGESGIGHMQSCEGTPSSTLRLELGAVGLFCAHPGGAMSPGRTGCCAPRVRARHQGLAPAVQLHGKKRRNQSPACATRRASSLAPRPAGEH